ncbi:hypothetical protein GOP47_0008824 [Adiantum capillus-veneris]|uniref:Uncharacterized protein n=1 Tax=Adiantum capillus-veneris TaxID=13818 RepID=A0A9D4UZB1_ADICA|nr:hypothetical protein GOP47_0008824 [Adiantum capillus-veneris]
MATSADPSVNPSESNRASKALCSGVSKEAFDTSISLESSVRVSMYSSSSYAVRCGFSEALTTARERDDDEEGGR